jgi:hypothetical protein
MNNFLASAMALSAVAATVPAAVAPDQVASAPAGISAVSTAGSASVAQILGAIATGTYVPDPRYVMQMQYPVPCQARVGCMPPPPPA